MAMTFGRAAAPTLTPVTTPGPPCASAAAAGAGATASFACSTAAANTPTRNIAFRDSTRQLCFFAKYKSPKCSRSSLQRRCHHSAQVVVTREAGKNAKLVGALKDLGISCLELPLVEHIKGPDVDKLASVLCENRFDWVLITSPEAGLVFLDAWRDVGRPFVQIAVVGAGTAAVFKHAERMYPTLKIGFSPSKATGAILAMELPKMRDGSPVLYPASLKASNETEQGLIKRGFQVTRLNTYTTVTVHELSEELVEKAARVPVVALASPSAVRAWADVISKFHDWDGIVACIGETSAAASRESGFKKIFYPVNPGFEGWVDSILAALRSRHSHQEQSEEVFVCV